MNIQPIACQKLIVFNLTILLAAFLVYLVGFKKELWVMDGMFLGMFISKNDSVLLFAITTIVLFLLNNLTKYLQHRLTQRRHVHSHEAD
jgi:sterol desaturase/sphingolipid hydroxylase (fatty acid hydroxylase superfamily)